MATLSIEQVAGGRWDIYVRDVDDGLHITTKGPRGDLVDLALIHLDDDGWAQLAKVIEQRTRELDGEALHKATHHTEVEVVAGRFIGKCDKCPQTNADQTMVGALDWATAHGTPSQLVAQLAVSVKA